MELYLHDVNEIQLTGIGKLAKGESYETYVRRIVIKTERGEIFKITCFGGGKEKLQTKTEKVKT